MGKTAFKSSHKDAYESGILWREEEPSLPNNDKIAQRRLQSLEKKFESCPEIRDMQSQSKMTLNKKIYTGADLLSSELGVFLRFCEGRIAMAADVSVWRSVCAIQSELQYEAQCCREWGRFTSG